MLLLSDIESSIGNSALVISLRLEEKGAFRAQGKLKSLLSSNTEFTEVVQNAMKEDHALGQQYANFMAGDEKLIGQEKATLKQRVSSLLSLLIQVRVYLEKAYFQRNVIESDNFDEGFSFTFHLDNYE